MSSAHAVPLTCSIQLSGTVDSPVTVASTWRKDGATPANSAKTSISQIQQLSSSLYHTTLTLSDLSQSNDAGEYFCEALVAANPSSSYIATSSVASVSLTLTVQGRTGHSCNITQIYVYILFSHSPHTHCLLISCSTDCFGCSSI